MNFTALFMTSTRSIPVSVQMDLNPLSRQLHCFAEAQILDRDVTDPGWYPGKYLSEVVERLSNRSSGMDRSAPTAVESTQQAGTSVDPDTQAVFKTVLKQDGTVTIPEAEIAALNLTEGELLQVIAYSIEDE